MRTRADYRAALYMRLSKDDDGAAESASITTQRQMLRSYAAEHGYAVYDEYSDDGYSGVSFDRPEFRRMIADIEAKKVNLVIIKDLSRLGRDYITAGQYTEIYFPSKGVRCIAVNDGYDSEGPYTDIAPFKNVINEMYARDISKKIRSAFAAKMREGAYVAAFAPYGYQKDAADKNRLAVDACSGEVVKRIFTMAEGGAKPADIARTLNAEGVPSPAAYRCIMHGGSDANLYSRQEWTGSTVGKMLRNMVYIGHTAQGKTEKASFKSRVSVSKARDEWIIVKNTHKALVDEETFDIVQRRIRARTCPKKGGFGNIFSGIAKCADCGRNMSSTGTRKKDSQANLCCGGYKLYGAEECGNHFIDYDALYKIVLAELRERLNIGEAERAKIADNVYGRLCAQRRGEDKESGSIKRRLNEIESIIGRLYEDNAAGRLSDERTGRLAAQYEKEAEALEERMNAIKNEKEAAAPREKLSRLLERITDITALTPNVLFRLIDHIEIAQGYYEQTAQGRIKRQSVKIFYRFKTEDAEREYTF